MLVPIVYLDVKKYVCFFVQKTTTNILRIQKGIEIVKIF